MLNDAIFAAAIPVPHTEDGEVSHHAYTSLPLSDDAIENLQKVAEYMEDMLDEANEEFLVKKFDAFMNASRDYEAVIDKMIEKGKETGEEIPPAVINAMGQVSLVFGMAAGSVARTILIKRSSEPEDTPEPVTA